MNKRFWDWFYGDCRESGWDLLVFVIIFAYPWGLAFMFENRYVTLSLLSYCLILFFSNVIYKQNKKK